jgi:hypothetical protein
MHPNASCFQTLHASTCLRLHVNWYIFLWLEVKCCCFH